jgi:hypothetical protein
VVITGSFDSAPTPVKQSDGSALALPAAGSANAKVISWRPDGEVAVSVTDADVSSDPSGKTELSSDSPLLGTDADGNPWAVFAGTTTVAGSGLQPDQVSHPISAFRLDQPGREWQVDALLGAPQPVDPDVDVALFAPSAIAGHVVIGVVSGFELGQELVALRLSDGSVAWRRPLSGRNWHVADGAVFVDASTRGADSPTAEIDDPDTGTALGSFTASLFDAQTVGFAQMGRWVIEQTNGPIVVVDGHGNVVGQRDRVDEPPRGDLRSGIVVVHFDDGHFEGVDTTSGSTLWTIDGGLVRNTDFQLTGVGDGFVSGTTKSGAVALDIHTGKQVWTGTLTAAAPLGEVVAGRLLTCHGTTDSSSSAGTAALSIPVTGTPVGLDHDTPIYP